MNASRQMRDNPASAIDESTLVKGIKQALALDHSRMLEVARNYWERKYAGNDPSDACVSVRITSGKLKKKTPLPCGGILKRKRRRLLS